MKIKSIHLEEIKKTALLGTDRRPLSATLLELAAQLGIDKEQSQEKILANLILATDTFLRTAQIFPSFKKEILAHQKQSDQLSNCPPQIAQLIPRILRKDYQLILIEFQNILQENGWKFPSQYLPELLDRSAGDFLFWEKVKGMLLPQALKLIRQNKQWSLLTPDVKQSKTLTVGIYITERSIDIKLANQRLLEEWKTITPSEKLKILEHVAKEIHQEDEILLNQYDKEKSKKTKELISQLVCFLPNSKIHQSRAKFFRTLFDKKKNLALPELQDSDRDRLKISARHSKFQGGMKANQLAQVLVGTSYADWASLFKKPKLILSWAASQEWSDQIFYALVCIAVREKNSDLRTELFKYFHTLNEALPDYYDLLFKHLATDEFETLVLWSIDQGKGILDKEGIFVKLALHYQSPWSDSCTFAFFKLVKKWLKENPKYWEGWYIWRIMHQLSFLCNAGNFPIMIKAFQNDAIWALAEEEVKSFLNILKFRQQLYLTSNE